MNVGAGHLRFAHSSMTIDTGCFDAELPSNDFNLSIRLSRSHDTVRSVRGGNVAACRGYCTTTVPSRAP